MTARRIVLRCDAGPIAEIGTGHLHRCLLLATALRERGADVTFAGHHDEPSRQRIARAGFERIAPPEDGDEAALLGAAVAAAQPEVLVLDRLDSDADAVATVRDAVPVLVTIDDQGSGAELADIVVNAHVPGGDPVYSHYGYVVIPPAPRRIGGGHHDGAQRQHVVVTVGGYDHARAGAVIAEALAAPGEVDVDLLARTGSVDPAPAHVRLREDVPDFGGAIREADVAIVNGGLSLFEALANGVPAVAIAQYEHQQATIAQLARFGAVVPAGRADDGVVDRVQEATVALLRDEPRQAELRRKGGEAVDGGGLARVRDLLMVVERRDWDSAFFGVEIARIHPLRLTPGMLDFALARCEEMGTECAYYLCDCHDAQSVRLAEAAGFNFVDIRLTFERRLTDIPAYEPEVRLAHPGDLPAIQEIARAAYQDSRYYFDHQFSREDCERFYTDWMTKCVHGELADRVFVLADDAGVVGYVAITHEAPATASIVFVGVAERARRAGVARRIIDHAVRWAADEGYSTVTVATQGRNYQAQRLYQRQGFVTAKTELWYHRWWR